MKTKIGEVTIRHRNMESLKVRVEAALGEVEQQLVPVEHRLADVEKERSRLMRQRQAFQRFLGPSLRQEPKSAPESNNPPPAKEPSHQLAVWTEQFSQFNA